MPKRGRKRHNSRDREYSKKRRYTSCSPTRGRDTWKASKHSQSKGDMMDTATEIRMLKMKLDLLTAQINLLRKQLHYNRQAAHTGKEAHKSFCILM